MMTDENSNPASPAVAAGLEQYYRKYYPANEVCEWLSRLAPLNRREFSFTFDDVNGGAGAGQERGKYVRYKCFGSANELRLVLSNEVPTKFDVGAVYPASLASCEFLLPNVKPIARELAFDIDLTDYDDVRFCQCGGSICVKCWPLAAAAIVVTDRELREAFGFQKTLWIFSGGRGVHCWVYDAAACSLTDNQRALLLDHLRCALHRRADNKNRLQIGRDLRPFEEIMYEQLLPLFRTYIGVQNLFLVRARYKPLLDMIPCSRTRSQLESEWTALSVAYDRNDTDLSRWTRLEHLVTSRIRTEPFQDNPNVLVEIVLSVLAPRFDINVTQSMGHLLKAPFAVHPKTKRICVPIDVRNVANFDPAIVPTLRTVTDNVTPLTEYVALFRRLTTETQN
jgi:DNA primase small subunit